MNDSSRQITNGALLSYLILAFSAIAGLIYTPWMVRTIGASDFGLYTLATSITALFLSDLGMGEAATRFMAKFYAREEEDRIAGFLGTVFLVHLAIALALAILFALIYFNIEGIYGNLTSSELVKLKDIFLIVSVCSVIGLPLWPFKSVLYANERFTALKVCDLLNKVCSVLLIVILLLAGFDVFAVVLVNSLCSLFFSLVQAFLALRLTTARPSFRSRARGTMRELLGFSLWTLVVQLCQRLIFTIMPSVLAITLDSWAVALFGLASQLEGYLWSTGNALGGSFFMPSISRILAQDDDAGRLQELMEKVGRAQLHVIGLLVVGFFALGGLFVDCWMGPGYQVLFPCVALLFIPALFELPSMTGNAALVAAGEVKRRAFIFVLMAVVNVVLGFFLSTSLGVVGACLSITVAYLVRTFGLWAMYRSRLGFSPLHFLKTVYPSWLIPAVVVYLLGLVLVRFVPLGGWLGLAVDALVMVVVYGAICWRFSLKPGERSFVSSFLAQRFKRG